MIAYMLQDREGHTCIFSSYVSSHSGLQELMLSINIRSFHDPIDIARKFSMPVLDCTSIWQSQPDVPIFA